MNFKQHPLSHSVILHLFPGLVGTVVYVVLAPKLMANGYPALLGMLVAAAAVILPLLLGILLYQAQKTSRSFSLRAVIGYREPLPKWQYGVIPLGLVIWGFLANGITAILDQAIAQAWFAWLPEWFFILDLAQFAAYARPALLLTFFVGLVVNGIALPLVEELYFRGYLLPRLARFGKWAPLINLSLFSLYHFWAPAQLLSRIVWMLPWVYLTWYKRNIYLLVITHCAANTLGWLLTWGLILGG